MEQKCKYDIGSAGRIGHSATREANPTISKKSLGINLILAFLLFGVNAINAGNSLIVAPVADAYVWEAHPTNNYGSEQLIKLETYPGNNRYGFLKFDTSPIGSGGIDLATVWVVPTDEGPWDISLYGVADTNWGETTITWNNHPAVGSFIYGIDDSIWEGEFHYSGIWVLPYMTNQQHGLLSFAVTNTTTASGSNVISLRSREDTNSSISPFSNYTPYLWATYFEITNQPQSQVINIGGNAIFSVGVDGYAYSTSITNWVYYSYQWYKNGQIITNAHYSGFTIDSVQPSDEGDYTVVITSNYSGDTTTSAAARLVVPHADLSLGEDGDGNPILNVSASGPSDYVIAVEHYDLNPNVWDYDCNCYLDLSAWSPYTHLSADENGNFPTTLGGGWLSGSWRLELFGSYDDYVCFCTPLVYTSGGVDFP